jgi:hypothetical protein
MELVAISMDSKTTATIVMKALVSQKTKMLFY